MLTVLRGAAVALFPTLNPGHLETRIQSERDDAFVAEHIRKRAPILQREFARNRAKVALALVAAAEAVAELTGCGREEVVTETLMAGDFNEAGRLLAVRVDALLLEEAKDAAELEAQQMLDALELDP